MLLDDHAPDYQIAARYEVEVRAPPDVVYDAVRRLDLSRSFVVRILFALRGLPNRELNLDSILGRGGFVLLGEEPPQELLLGLIGRFWTPRGDIQRFEPQGFRPFDRPGYAKAAWQLLVVPRPSGDTLLVTETRVQCTDASSLRRFRWYWRLVGPFSGLVRKQTLDLIKGDAEDLRTECT